MNLKTTKRIERAKWHVRMVIERERKAAKLKAPPAVLSERGAVFLDRSVDGIELQQLWEEANKDWNFWYNRVKALQIAAAQRADKGEELFTVYRPSFPGSDDLKEITVTPRLVITKHLRQAWYVDKPIPPHVELRLEFQMSLEFALKELHEWGRQYDCKPEKAAEFRRKKTLPAWAKEAA